MQVVRFACNFTTLVSVYSATRAPVKTKSMCKELKTPVLRLVPRSFNGPLAEQEDGLRDGEEVLEKAVQALKGGGVVAVPTDTIYGLACLAQNSQAVKTVYDIKRRNGQRPLAICVGEIEDIYKYCKTTVPKALLRDLLPGPVTLVLDRSEELNVDLNPFTPLVGVRIPDHPFMRRLSQMCGEPLALTSANVSSHTSTVAVHEFEYLWPRLALVVDGGPIGDESPESRLGSTVVDLSVPGKYHVIRPGCALSTTIGVLQHKYGLSEERADQ